MTSPSTSSGIFTPSESESTTTAKKGGCGTGCDDNSSPSIEIDERTKERIAKHPCYSEEAHHHYARTVID
jgi:nitrogen fixation protein NifB